MHEQGPPDDHTRTAPCVVPVPMVPIYLHDKSSCAFTRATTWNKKKRKGSAQPRRNNLARLLVSRSPSSLASARAALHVRGGTVARGQRHWSWHWCGQWCGIWSWQRRWHNLCNAQTVRRTHCGVAPPRASILIFRPPTTIRFADQECGVWAAPIIAARASCGLTATLLCMPHPRQICYERFDPTVIPANVGVTPG